MRSSCPCVYDNKEIQSSVCALKGSLVQSTTVRSAVCNDRLILIVKIGMTLITRKHQICVRVIAAIVIAQVAWLIANFCVWMQMVSCIGTEERLVFPGDIIEKWLCVFLFSERRYYTKDLL